MLDWLPQTDLAIGQQLLAAPGSTGHLLAVVLSLLGNGYVFTAACFGLALVAWNKRQRIWAWRWALLWLAVTFGQLALKYAFQRPRPPFPVYLVEPGLTLFGAYSFPSGHAMAAGALFSMLVMQHAGCNMQHEPRSSGQRLWTMGYGLWAMAFLLTAAVSWSRVALGVHYASDVIAGAFFGWTVSVAVRRGTKN